MQEKLYIEQHVTAGPWNGRFDPVLVLRVYSGRLSIDEEQAANLLRKNNIPFYISPLGSSVTTLPERYHQLPHLRYLRYQEVKIGDKREWTGNREDPIFFGLEGIKQFVEIVKAQRDRENSPALD